MRLWLQNTVNMPVLLTNNQHIRNFLRDTGITGSQLLDLTDRLNLNVAVLDDLLTLAEQSKAPRVSRSNRGRTARKGLVGDIDRNIAKP